MLQPLLQNLVFVGGCTRHCLLRMRRQVIRVPTYECRRNLAELSTYGEYARFSERLRWLGFKEDQSEGAPICRWRCDERDLGCHAQ